jgi:hypothetical protein
MAKQTFEIIDGVYRGPRVWKEDLSLVPYKNTLTSLGSLQEVKGDLELDDCSKLGSLGKLVTVKGCMFLCGCTSLKALEPLKYVGPELGLSNCTSLTSLGSLQQVNGWVTIEGCQKLVSLGSLQTVKGRILVNKQGDSSSLSGVQRRIIYYSSLPAHEALNALHTDEVQEVPLYKNILLSKLQGC